MSLVDKPGWIRQGLIIDVADGFILDTAPVVEVQQGAWTDFDIMVVVDDSASLLQAEATPQLKYILAH
jgi:hypothetical protein